MVANTAFADIELEDNVRFLNELRRHNYVTPTSYLEMIRTFKKLLGLKRNELTMMRNRYLTGLEKLEFAAGEVGKMQVELVELQPQLIVTGQETDKLLAKVAKDTIQLFMFMLPFTGPH
ncbi:unnamed protein product [Dibothriocephalus latus]|uniref:Dynein heavy chain AAA module D4 domain-containing protein n=1 Tax=Dibothriocephalus latus TaxID=60516 RepID=A0A3P7MVT1_DIBLA|nr:unnamed protein product [Dibothriocephalus latus]